MRGLKGNGFVRVRSDKGGYDSLPHPCVRRKFEVEWGGGDRSQCRARPSSHPRFSGPRSPRRWDHGGCHQETLSAGVPSAVLDPNALRAGQEIADTSAEPGRLATLLIGFG